MHTHAPNMKLRFSVTAIPERLSIPASSSAETKSSVLLHSQSYSLRLLIPPPISGIRRLKYSLYKGSSALHSGTKESMQQTTPPGLSTLAISPTARSQLAMLRSANALTTQSKLPSA
mgnify:FL=1